jgi:pyruvate dehydrogenase E2 component (dihydrolipoamide acetyltransferase)
MAYEFLLPDLGEGLAEAEIVNWLVAIGDTVVEDQPIAEVQTAKANVEIPSPVAGRVSLLGAQIGQVLAVGAVLIAFETAFETADETADDNDGSSSGPTPEAEAVAAPVVAPIPPASTSGQRRVLASPSTRKFAVEHDVDLAMVAGTAAGGRVSLEDVQSFLAAQTVATEPATELTNQSSGVARPRHAPNSDEVVPLRGIRREVARSMTRAWQEVPHVTEFREVDATHLMRALRALRALRERAPDGEPKLTLLSLMVLPLRCGDTAA